MKERTKLSWCWSYGRIRFQNWEGVGVGVHFQGEERAALLPVTFSLNILASVHPMDIPEGHPDNANPSKHRSGQLVVNLV